MLTGFAYARPQLEEALLRAVRGMGVEEVPDLELQRARNPRNGDYASPVAMKLARALHEAPPQIAARLAQRIGELPEAEIEVAGPYLNFRLRAEWLHRLATVAALDERYDRASWVGASGSRWSSAASTPPVPSTSVTAAAWCWATRSPASSSSPVTRSNASTTSTTRTRRRASSESRYMRGSPEARCPRRDTRVTT